MRALWCWGLLLLAASLTASVTVVSQSDTRVVLRCALTDLQLHAQDQYTYIQGNDLQHETKTGLTDLPFFEVRFGTPENGYISARIVREETREMTLDHPVAPVPAITTDTGYQFTGNPLPPEKHNIVEVQPSFRFRSMTMASLRISPLEVRGRKLIVHDNLLIEVSIEGSQTSRQTLPEDPICRSMVLNYDTAKNWQTNPKARTVQTADFSGYNFWASFEVNKDGVFKITYDELLTALSQTELASSYLRLFSTGGALMSYTATNGGLPFLEVPIEIVTGSDNVFNTGDYILFYAHDRDGYTQNSVISDHQYFNPYSQSTVYWLAYGAGSGTPARIQVTDPGTPAVTRNEHVETVHIEQETVKRESEGFDWFSANFAYIDNLVSEYSYHFTASNVVPGSAQSCKLRVQQAETSSSAELRLEGWMNGILFLGNDPEQEEGFWDDDSEHVFTDTTEDVQNGDNTLLLRLTRGAVTNVYFDYYEIAYEQLLTKSSEQKKVNPWSSQSGTITRWSFSSGYNANLRAYEANTFSSVYSRPVSADGSGFLVTSGNIGALYVFTPDETYPVISLQSRTPVSLLNEAPDYDAVIVAPAEFIDRAETLAGYYQDDLELKAVVVDQQDVFNQFSGGMPDPMALRHYTKYLHTNGAPMGYLTLLGSGVFDWRNFAGSTGTKARILAFQESASSSDDNYGYWSQEAYPELAIGRYPVQNVEQLDIMLDHVRYYLEDTEKGWWRNTLLFVADDEHKSQTHDGIDHTANLQLNAADVTRACYIDKVFSIEYDMDEYHNKPQVRDLVIGKVNKGALIWYYTGHGGPDLIGDERYLSASDFPLFDNLEHMPLFIAASCSVGEYDLYSIDCLCEQIVYQENGGAIASIGGTRKTLPGPNTTLFGYFFERAVNDRNPLGIALMRAKFNISSYTRSNSEYYNLLGDPTLPIIPPQRTANISLLDSLSVYSTLQTVHFSGDFGDPSHSGTAEIRVLDSEKTSVIVSGATYTYTNSGNPIYRGSVSVQNGQFSGSFVIPYDITQGTTARILLDFQTDSGETIAYASPLTFQGHTFVAGNPDAPAITLWMDSKGFTSGDPVGSAPTLIASVADSNGVNILGTPGHRVITRIDDSTEFSDITSYFNYNLDSHTNGELEYPFSGLEKGTHTVEVIAVDNLNTPAIASTQFRVTSDAGESAKVSIENDLPCPNPWNGKDRFYFTFFITENADVTISLYTMSGKKIQSIKAPALNKGYQQIQWNGHDADGDKLANNTYFYKIKAKATDGSSSDEVTGKFVIYR